MSFRDKTIRQDMRMQLDGPVSVKDLSARFGMSFNEVVDHLDHIIQSAKQEGFKLVIDPALCEKCEYLFEDRSKLTKPSRCPKCKGERILHPTFYLENRLLARSS